MCSNSNATFDYLFVQFVCSAIWGPHSFRVKFLAERDEIGNIRGDWASFAAVYRFRAVFFQRWVVAWEKSKNIEQNNPCLSNCCKAKRCLTLHPFKTYYFCTQIKFLFLDLSSMQSSIWEELTHHECVKPRSLAVRATSCSCSPASCPPSSALQEASASS